MEVTASTYVCNPPPAGLPWVAATGATVAMSPNTGYLADNAAGVAFTLPAAPAPGAVVRIVGTGKGPWRITQAVGQTILTRALGLYTWTARESSRFWQAVASSADGSRLVAGGNGTSLYVASSQTTPGPAGSLSGGPFDALELVHLGIGKARQKGVRACEPRCPSRRADSGAQGASLSARSGRCSRASA